MIEGCKNYLQYLWGKILPQSKYQDYLIGNCETSAKLDAQ